MPTLRQVIDEHVPQEITAYDAIARWLNERPMKANPITKAPKIKITPDVGEVSKLVPSAELSVVVAVNERLKLAESLASSMGQGFVRTPARLLEMLVEGGISEGTETAIANYLATEIDDPSWQAKILDVPRWEAFGLERSPNASAVQAAMVWE